MSLVKCRDCGNEVSVQAKACPKCGAPVTRAKKRTSPITWAVAGLFGIAIVFGIAKAPHPTAPTPPTPQEKQIADAKNSRLARAIEATAALRTAMKDPEAFVLKELVVMDDGAGCITYRAKNSFNATLQSTAVFVPGAKSQLLTESRDGNRFVLAWNNRCTKAGGEVVTALAERLISR